MTSTRRSRLAGMSVLLTALVIGLIVFLATQANARPGSQTTTNDGGAWLVNRQAGYVAHANRLVGELSDSTKVGEPSQPIDVYQPAGLITVHDQTNLALILVDERTHGVRSSIELPELAEIHEYRHGLVITAPAPDRIWRLSTTRLAELERLHDQPPLISSDVPLTVAVSADGNLGYAEENGSVWVLPVGAETADAATRARGDFPTPVQSGVRDLTFVGRTLVSLHDSGDVVVYEQTGPARFQADESLQQAMLLSHPTRTNDQLLLMSAEDGTLITLDRTTSAWTAAAAGVGEEAVRPIHYNGCGHGLTQTPLVLTRICAGGEAEQHVLGDGGGTVRLRLVNGWVWLNDVENGSFWLSRPGELPSRVDDWGNVLPRESLGDSDDDPIAGGGDGAENQVENPDAADAETVRADDFDEDGINQPPVASDDAGQTIVGRPMQIDVLANDVDPDNDVLIIESVENLTPTAAQVVVAPDGDEVQVTPEAGFVGRIEFTYTINDGRGSTARASGMVDVVNSDGFSNRPPDPVTDVGFVEAGERLLMNVLLNDRDPDGDLLVLESVEADSGTVQFDPSGQVIFEPDSTSGDGEVGLRYRVSDDYGQVSEGKVRVTIRSISESNLPPDARNDLLVTTVGQPRAINLLANDDDPDGDVLFVAQRPELFSPEGADDLVTATVSPDGEFVVEAQEPGTYVFAYAASDGGASDAAQIRVEVSDQDTNRPPIGLRDDVVIPVGGTRIVYVLDNDGDPDGDVVGIVDVSVSANSGLVVEDFFGVGFKVTVLDNAPSRPTFHYAISDGVNDSVTASVVVATSKAAPVNQPPVAQSDVVEMRSGRVLAVPVLANDFDPEGGALRVVAVSQPDSATVSVGPEGQFVRVDTDAGTQTSFTVAYDVADEEGNRSAAVLRVQMVPDGQANRPPVARPDVTRTDFETAVVVGLLGNDTDPDGDAIGFDFIRRQPDHGLAAVDPLTGEIGYTPDAGFSGTDRFVYSIIDSFGASAEGEVLIGVMPPERLNTPPEALDDSLTFPETSASVAIDVLANDFDLDEDQLRVTSVTQPVVGTVELVDGQVRYQPPSPITADVTDVFDYRISDGQGGADTATVTVVVTDLPAAAVPTPEPTTTATPVPTATPIAESDDPIPPIAVDDVTDLVRPGDLISVNVVLNDADPDGSVSDLEVTVDIAGAAVDGGVVSFSAPDSSAVYRYTITDVDGLTATATISVEVAELSPPVAVDDVVGPVLKGDPVQIPILANDYDADGGVITFQSATEGTMSGGVLNLVAPAATTQYRYTIADTDGLTATGIITVLVTDNRAPEISPLRLETEFEAPLAIDIGGQASDPDGDDLFFVCCGNQRGGGTSIDASAANAMQVTFTPDKGFSGPAAFTYTVDDRKGHIVSGTVAILVAEGPEPNRPPVAVSGSVRVKVESQVSLDLATLTDDPNEDDVLSWSVEQSAYDGLSISLTDSTLTVDAETEAPPGDTAISYTVTDADGETASAAIAIVILPPDNEIPVALDEQIEVPAGSSTSLDLASLASDADPGALLEYNLLTVPTEQVSVDLNGSVATITASINQTGTETVFVYTAVDRWSASDNGTVSIRVTEPDVAKPEAVDDEGTTLQAQPVTINVLANDIDHLGNGLTIVSPGVTSDGTTSASGSNIVFAPDPQFFGQTTFSYTIRDIAGTVTREDSAQVTVEVIGRPDKPSPPAVVDGSGQVSLTWSTPLSNGDEITLYAVEHDQGGSAAPGLTNSHVWSGLTNGNTYAFRVQALNAAGWSEWSDWSVPATPDTEPEAPAAPTCESLDGQLRVDWTEPVNNGSALVGYEVSLVGGDVQPVGVESITWPNLSNGVAYKFQVRSQNQAGYSPWSAMSPACIPSTTPGVPSPGDTTRGDQFLVVNWSALTAGNDGGVPVLSYDIWSVSTNEFASVPGASTASYNWPNLQNGQEYVFRIRAVNTNGNGDWSIETLPTVPCGLPPAPAALTVDAPDPDDSRINLSWPTPADNGCPILETVLVWDTGTVTLPGDSLSHTLTGRTNGVTHNLQLRVRNDVGDSLLSAPVSATPAGRPLCGDFQFLPTATDVRQVDLTWSPALDNGRTVTDYKIRVDGGVWSSVGVTNSHSFTNLPGDGQQYVFEIVAANAVGDSEICGQVTETTCDVPGQLPAPLLGVQNVIDLAMTWDEGSVAGDSCPPVDFYRTWIVTMSTQDHSGGTTAETWTGVPDYEYVSMARACNSIGCGEWSAESDAVTVLRPIPYVTAQSGTTTAATCPGPRCRWARVVEFGGFKPSTAYDVTCEWAPSSNGSYTTFLTVTITTGPDGKGPDHNPCSHERENWIRITIDGPPAYDGGPTSVISDKFQLNE